MRDHLIDRFTRTKADYRPKRPGFMRWWMFWPDDVAIHKAGRTCPEIGSMYSFERIQDLADLVGFEFPRGWNDLSEVQQIDFITTWWIAQTEEQDRTHCRDVLSKGQWHERIRREIPMTLEQMEAILLHVERSQLYRGGKSSRPEEGSGYLRNRGEG